MNTNRINGMLDDRSLITRAQSGDHEAFDALMRKYEARMFRTAMRILGNESEAEDAVQQAFLAAFQNLSRFRGDSALTTWLTRITMNESLGIVRKRRKNLVALAQAPHQEGDGTVHEPASEADTPEEAALRAERRRLVHESMRLVRPSYLRVMKLRVIEDLSVEEIGQRLEMPLNTVKVHLFRGRKAMKEYLSPRLASLAA